MKFKIFLIVLVLMAAAAGSATLYIQFKQPVREGEISLGGLQQAVEVVYDSYGVPHIYADNKEDAYRALGYVHAQHRLFQMEMLRRLSQGRLAEVLGERLLPFDRMFRTLGIEHHAGLWAQAIRARAAESPEHADMLPQVNAYLAGVNQLAKEYRPLEFDVLGIPEHQYSLEDILSIAGYMAFSFGQALEEDPMLTFIANDLGTDYLADLDIYTELDVEAIPTFTPETAVEVSKLVTQQLKGLTGFPLFHGSNAWVLGPDKTESGEVVFVNDPHIGLAQPSVWYEAHIQTPDFSLYGHHLALVPFALLGHNQNHAWGLTMFENDDMDLYQERLHPESDNLYWYQPYEGLGEWRPFTHRVERIEIKGQPAELLTVKSSHHGPIINAMFPEGENPVAEQAAPIAVWWQFLNTDNQLIQAFYDLAYADTVDKAAAAAAKIHAPGLNIMYGNQQGDIAWWAAAKIPVRDQYSQSKFVLDGASGTDEILYFQPFEENPKAINPPWGYVYSANNQPEGNLPGYYSPKDRPTRIQRWLSSSQRLSVSQMQSMLMDSVSEVGLEFRDQVVQLREDGNGFYDQVDLTAFQILQKWNGDHGPESVGATIYNKLRQHYLENTFADELGEEKFKVLSDGFLLDRSLWQLLRNPDSIWFDKQQTDELETQRDILQLSWTQTITELTIALGADPEKWQWKKMVRLEHVHAIGRIPPFDKVFNVGPVYSPAGVEVLNNLTFSYTDDKKQPFKVTVGPSTRRIIDFANPERSWGINPTGQSGVLFDEHYDDQAKAFGAGEFRWQLMARDDIDAQSKSKVTFVP